MSLGSRLSILWNMWSELLFNKPEYNYKEDTNSEMKSMFYETGAFYFLKAHNFFKSKKEL